jgi:competence CoiA-like predicted nuclease
MREEVVPIRFALDKMRSRIYIGEANNRKPGQYFCPKCEKNLYLIFNDDFGEHFSHSQHRTIISCK